MKIQNLLSLFVSTSLIFGEITLMFLILPAQNPFDLSKFSLQLPIGKGNSPKTIKNTLLNSPRYQFKPFFSIKGNAYLFRHVVRPPKGVHTANSKFTRCELREVLPIAWDMTKGTHVFTTEQKILVLPNAAWKKSIKSWAGVVFQIHGKLPAVTLIGLTVNKNSMTSKTGDLAVKFNIFETGSTILRRDHFTLIPNYKMGTRYSLEIKIIDGFTNVTVNSIVDGLPYTKTVSSTERAVSDTLKTAYFKAGSYSQTAFSTDPIVNSQFGDVLIYKVKVSHS